MAFATPTALAGTPGPTAIVWKWDWLQQQVITSNDKLVLHCDGSDDGTTFTDSSPSAHTVTPTNAVTKTGTKKFGTASAYFDGSGDYLAISDSDDFNFGTGNFTIDLWVYRDSDTSDDAFNFFVSHSNTSSGGNDTMSLGYYKDSSQTFFNVTSGGSTLVSIWANSALSLNTWYHIAIVRNGNVFTLYKDGTSIGTQTTSITYPNYTSTFYVGRLGDATPTRYMRGYIDELRVSKGVARWTAAFDVPVLPHYTYTL